MNIRNLHFIYVFLLGISASFPLLPYGLRSVSTILSLSVAIILAIKHIKVSNKSWLAFFYFNIPILILSISLFYSGQVDEGIKDLTQMLSLVAFPLAFVLHSISKKEVRFLKLIFIFSVLILILYQAAKIGLNYDILFAPPSTDELKMNGITSISEASFNEIQSIKTRRVRNFLHLITNTHPTYQAIWSIFAIALLVDLKIFLKNLRKKVFSLISLIILTLWVFILASRMPLVAGALSTIIIGFKFPIKTKLIFIASVIGLSLLAYFFMPNIQYRVNEVLVSSKNLIQSDSDVRDFNSTNIRLGIYSCALELHQSRPLLGFGLGNVQNHLSKCLVTKINPEIYNWRIYNTHNQYLYFLLTTGILGVIFLFIWIFKLFQIAFRNKTRLFSFLLNFILICFLTENIWSRNDGVLFFGFFSGLLLFNFLNPTSK